MLVLGVSCLLAEWISEDCCNVRKLSGCGDSGCLCCVPPVQRHCSQQREKIVPGTVPPLASASVCSFLETVFVPARCKLPPNMFSLLSKDIILKGK